MAVAVTYTSNLSVVETLADLFLAAADKTVTHSGLNKQASYNSGTAVPVTKVATFRLTLSEGAGQIDLRALLGTNGAAVDGNGLKVQAVKLVAKADNANPITIEPAAENGYDLFGAGGSLTLKAGQEILLNLNESSDNVDATHKLLDVSGTGSQSLDCQFVLG